MCVTHPSLPPSIHESIQTFIRQSIRTRMHACMHACTHTHAYIGVPSGAPANDGLDVNGCRIISAMQHVLAWCHTAAGDSRRSDQSTEKCAETDGGTAAVKEDADGSGVVAVGALPNAATLRPVFHSSVRMSVWLCV